MTITPDKTLTLLLNEHDQLNELFLKHQEALIDGVYGGDEDRILAKTFLQEFQSSLETHMKMEEEILMPIFVRAPRITGGPPEFFIGEHKKMLELLARIKEKLFSLTTFHKRDIIALLDQESFFKSLVEHHDSREETIFYPTLDKVTSLEERIELFGKISGNHPSSARPESFGKKIEVTKLE